MVLMAVWDELKHTIRVWMNGGTMNMNNMNAMHGIMNPAAAAASTLTSSGPAPSAASAGRAVLAMQAAVKLGGTEALLQAPLESIMGHDGCSLHAVKQAIELERRAVASRLAEIRSGAQQQLQQQQPEGMEMDGGNGQKAMVSYFTTIQANWDDSDFDSGAESDGGSDATDLDSDWDA